MIFFSTVKDLRIFGLYLLGPGVVVGQAAGAGGGSWHQTQVLRHETSVLMARMCYPPALILLCLFLVSCI